jgi:hypothetical protein
MSVKYPTTHELYRLLKEAKKSNEYIIDIFLNIIHTKQLYGGDISESINFQVERIKSELYK